VKQSTLLSISSLLSLLFLSFHHADDVVRGFAPGKYTNLIPIIFLAIWLYGTMLVFYERRSGYILILILSFLAWGVPVIHMTRAGMASPRIVNAGGALFFVWTLIAVGVTTVFSVMLCVRELWRLRRRQV
jgi:hypothetical protein